MFPFRALSNLIDTKIGNEFICEVYIIKIIDLISIKEGIQVKWWTALKEDIVIDYALDQIVKLF